jgi:hypothetical protein
MSPHIVIHWIGVRKDSGRGAVYGWFTETGKPDKPLPYYYRDEEKAPRCYIFYGRIGKELHIIESELTPEFITTMDGMKKNYRTEDPAKVTSRWGKRFEEDLSMFLLMLKMKQ